MRKVNYESGSSLAGAREASRPVGRVGIIGANNLSTGLAMGLVAADIPVTIFDRRDALDQALALQRSSYADSVLTGALCEDKRQRRLALVSTTVKFHHMKDCDLIIDVASVAIDVREKFFRWVDEIVKPSAIMLANAACVDVNHIARFTRRPADVLGVHFSSPDDSAEKLRLVRGRQTSEEAFDTAAALLHAIGKAAA
jgi:3-hydroxyacyl-CoA dehydrogenase